MNKKMEEIGKKRAVSLISETIIFFIKISQISRLYCKIKALKCYHGETIALLHR